MPAPRRSGTTTGAGPTKTNDGPASSAGNAALALLEPDDPSAFVFTEGQFFITPVQRGGGRSQEIDPEAFTDDDYREMFGFQNGGYVGDRRIFTPDTQLTDAQLLPSSEYVGNTIFGEIAETFQLDGDPHYAARRICTFDDLKIATEDRKLLTLGRILRSVQEGYLDTILPGWKEQFASKSPLTLTGLREFILKPRKLGFSTLILALFFLDTISTPNTQTVIIAHDTATTRKLFDIMRRFYRNLPPDKQPKTGYYSRQEIWFPELDSYIYVGTAGSGQYGRGGTIQNLMGSEAAFWPNPEDIVAGLFESVPLSGNIFVETTANGYGGWFDKTYFKSKKGETPFKARFFPWNIEAKYKEEIPDPDNFIKTEEEEQIAAAYKLSDEQIYWRRQKKATLGPLFEQEFPITDIEAFITSGRPYFNRFLLNTLYQAMMQDAATFAPLPAGEMGLDGAAFPELFREALRRGKDGTPHLCVWEPPMPGVMYVIGADVAEGEVVSDERDYDAASVVRVDTLEEVATLRGQWGNSKADYAILLSQLGFWYNEALLAVERNNHGLSVLNTLQNGRPGYEQWIYPPRRPGGGGLYYLSDLEERQNFAARLRRAKATGGQVIKKAGWHTNAKTRPLILNYLASLIQDELIALNSPVTVDELMKFVEKENGKSGGDGGSHDDTVIALAIAVFLAQTVDVYGSGSDTEAYGEGGSSFASGFTASGGNRYG